MANGDKDRTSRQGQAETAETTSPTKPTKDPLTALQRKWVTAYMGSANGNATLACRTAGYSGGNGALGRMGFDNLHNPKVSKEIAEIRAETRQEWSIEWWREKQEQVLADALAAGDRAAANQALQSIGKHLGVFEATGRQSTGSPTIVIHMPDSGCKAIDSIDLTQSCLDVSSSTAAAPDGPVDGPGPVGDEDNG